MGSGFTGRVRAGASGIFLEWCKGFFFLNPASVRAHAQFFRQTAGFLGCPSELPERPPEFHSLPSEFLNRPAEFSGRRAKLSRLLSEPFGRPSELPGRLSEHLKLSKIGQKSSNLPNFPQISLTRPSATLSHRMGGRWVRETKNNQTKH